jgi:hypothetical protein
MMDRLLGVRGIAKITLVTTKWTASASYTQRAEEEQREQLLRTHYWQGPLSCNSEMARYDNTRSSALGIIARLKVRERSLELPVDGCFPKTNDPPSVERDQMIVSGKKSFWRKLFRDPRSDLVMWPLGAAWFALVVGLWTVDRERFSYMRSSPSQTDWVLHSMAVSQPDGKVSSATSQQRPNVAMIAHVDSTDAALHTTR